MVEQPYWAVNKTKPAVCKVYNMVKFMGQNTLGALLVVFGVVCLATITTIQLRNANAKAQGKTQGKLQSNLQDKRLQLKAPYLVILILSTAGIGISIFVGSYVPFWILSWFSIIFSIEKWGRYYTQKHKDIGKLYRLVLNLSILSLLGLLIWSGVKLFSGHFIYTQLVGSLIFLGEFTIFIWTWRVISRNSWRWPSMKLTIFSLLFVSIVFVFAGVEPAVVYKDNLVSMVSPFSDYISSRVALSFAPVTPSVTTPINTPQPVIPAPAPALSPTPMPIPTPSVTVKPPMATITPAVPAAIIAGTTSNIDRSNFQALDQYALATPDSVTKSVDTLAAYLITPAKNDYEKTRVIYRWITQNIAYDYNAYLTGNYGSTTAASVLTSRSSICEGYSGLFSALAKSAGLEVVTIHGWAKGISYSAGDPIIGPTNHAWNAVKINGAWYLIDSTWGSGGIQQNKFVRDFNECYFLTLPDQFVYDHLPEDSKWQLLTTPISKTEYSTLPFVYSDFFKYGIQLGIYNQSVINTKGPLSMTLAVPGDTFLLVSLSQGNVELPDTLTSLIRQGNQYQITAKFPSPGNYILTLFARKGDQYGGWYDCVLDYKVVVATTP